MEEAFIIAVFCVWAIILFVGLVDKIGKGGHYEESDRDFLNRVQRENQERDRKLHEELKKYKN